MSVEKKPRTGARADCGIDFKDLEWAKLTYVAIEMALSNTTAVPMSAGETKKMIALRDHVLHKCRLLERTSLR